MTNVNKGAGKIETSVSDQQLDELGLGGKKELRSARLRDTDDRLERRTALSDSGGMVWNGKKGRWESPRAADVHAAIRERTEGRRTIDTYVTPRSGGNTGRRDYTRTELTVIPTFDKAGEIESVQLAQKAVERMVENVARNLATGFDELSLVLPTGSRAEIHRFVWALMEKCKYQTVEFKLVPFVVGGAEGHGGHED